MSISSLGHLSGTVEYDMGTTFLIPILCPFPRIKQDTANGSDLDLWSPDTDLQIPVNYAI